MRTRSRRLPSSSGDTSSFAERDPVLGLREGLRGPVHGHAQRDDAIAERAERAVQMREEPRRARARLRLVDQPAVAEEKAVRRGRQLLLERVEDARVDQAPVTRERQEQDAGTSRARITAPPP